MLKSWPKFIISIAVVILSTSAWADGGVDDGADDLSRLIGKPSDFSASAEVPVAGKSDALRLTSNKNELIRLDKDAASVIVNNPEHINVMLDSPRLLIVMPRLPGATSFTVLDNRGETIMQKDVIVTNVQAQYVRVRKICAGDAACAPATYYYCPDGCYEVTPVAPTASTGTPPPAGGNGGGSLDGGATEDINERAEEEAK